MHNSIVGVMDHGSCVSHMNTSLTSVRVNLRTLMYCAKSSIVIFKAKVLLRKMLSLREIVFKEKLSMKKIVVQIVKAKPKFVLQAHAKVNFHQPTRSEPHFSSKLQIKHTTEVGI